MLPHSHVARLLVAGLFPALLVLLSACGGGGTEPAADPSAANPVAHAGRLGQPHNAERGSSSASGESAGVLIMRDFGAGEVSPGGRAPLEEPPSPLPPGTITRQGAYGVPTHVVAYAYINPFTCAFIEGGTLTKTTLETKGKVEFTTENVKYGGSCPYTYPSAVARYTWGDAAAKPGDGDFFSLHFATASGVTADSNWLFALKPAVGVRIHRRGIDITDKKPLPSHAYLGERIDLSSVVELLDNSVHVVAEHWLIPGVHVGDFHHGPGESWVVPTTTDGPNVKFHWLSPGSTSTTAQTVEYIAKLSDNSTISATATFAVEGPDIKVVTPTYGKPYVAIGGPRGPKELMWAFGSRQVVPPSLIPGPGSAGMYIPMPVSALPTTNAGEVYWAQVLASESVGLTLEYPLIGMVNFSCIANEQSLDTQEVYLPTSDFWDTPHWDMLDDKIELSEPRALFRQFSATAYAMWDPKLPDSIPVPLGHVDWGFTMFTTYTPGLIGPCQSGNAPNYCTTYSTSPNPPVFNPSPNPPIWKNRTSGAELLERCVQVP